ncbi:hypothetical protein [Frankia sp. AgKG'84/4]|uniref:hypothetical protein n=1 Tax=Frankia sp. AgKG'84/4 TaxID=573490 RepID=UPI00200E6469|nr:hypothetical protein [Frankia sp. AgKG'84/4]MCL9796125.1 hypothetical protein [Frankia sp. AgKG'84/4]
MSPRASGTHRPGVHRRPTPFAAASRNALLRRILRLTAGGLAVGLAIGLVVGR